MVSIGNHMKLLAAEESRPRVRAFYKEVLGAHGLPRATDDVDLFQLKDGFVVGIFFVPADQALSERDHLKGAWLEIMSDDVSAMKEKVLAFGVKPLEYFDKAHFYFQAPGGQVYRLAPEAERKM